jgi:hypothetical protein
MYWCLPVFFFFLPCFGRGTCILEHSTILVQTVLYMLIVAHTYKVYVLKNGVFVKIALKTCMCSKVSRF